MIKMATVITVEEIAQCRTGPENDIDLLAVYGGHIREQHRKPGYKVNPLYNDTIASNPDINGNTRSLQVVTYETFPRTKQSLYKEEDYNDNSETKSTLSAIISNGKVDVTQNKFRLNYVHDDPASSTESNESFESELDQCKNTDSQLTVFESHYAEIETDTTKHLEHLDVNKNVPVLLGPANQHIHLQPSSNSPNMVAGDISLLEKHTHATSPLTPIQDVTVMDVSDLYASVKKVNSSAGTRRNYEVLKADDVNVVIQNQDVESVSHERNSPSNAKIEGKIVDKVTDTHDMYGYENKAFELSENVKNLEKGKEYRHPLQRQDSFDSDRDCEYSQVALVSVSNLHSVTGKDKTVACEIRTEAMVHTPNGSAKCNHEEYSGEKTKSSDSKSVGCEEDWPDIDQLVRPSIGNEDRNEDTKMQSFPVGHEHSDLSNGGVRRARSVSDTVQSDFDHHTREPQNTEAVAEHSKPSGYKKKKKHANGSTKPASASQNGSTRTLKSILTNGSSVSHCDCSNLSTQRASDSDSEIHEMKTVKFAKDTVFNENKSNKYKQEKVSHINLREIYCGKIASDTAVAKMNPLYREDELRASEESGQGSLTDDEKLAYRISLKKALKMSKDQGETFNQPLYMERYLILKAHGLKEDDDIEKLPEWMERPTYDRLIQRTLAKERRKCCVKWTFVLLTVMAITAIAVVLGVYFKKGS